MRELQRGMIYVMRRVNGVDVPLRIYNQLHLSLIHI